MTSFVEQIRQRLSSDFIQNSIEGCSKNDLRQLAEAQQIGCLPVAYQELMLFMGKRGLGPILNAYASVLDLRENLKGGICEELKLDRVAYPPDLFIFEADLQAAGFAFFRTQDCEDDPFVFSYSGGQGFRKLANNFSEYILWKISLYLMPDREARISFSKWYDNIKHTLYYYDSVRDEMLVK